MIQNRKFYTPLQAKTSNLDENSRVINAPTNAKDIATKEYVDANSSGCGGGGGITPEKLEQIDENTAQNTYLEEQITAIDVMLLRTRGILLHSALIIELFLLVL